MTYKVNLISGLAPDKDWCKEIHHVFMNCKKALGNKTTKLVLFSGADFTSHGSNAWTAADRVHLMLNSTNVPRGLSQMNLTRNTPMEYIAFLCVHEIGHHVYAPESIIPYAAAGQLITDVLGDTYNPNGPNACADIIVNSSLMMEPNIKHYTGYEGAELVRRKFLQENNKDMATVDYTHGAFFDWQMYYYRLRTNNPLPKPSTGDMGDLIEKIIAKKKPCYAWLDEFYIVWTSLLIAYKESW